MKINSHQFHLHSQQGVALITSLIIMLLITIVALSVFRNNNLIEKMTGNTREKQRSFQAAQAALQFGEWWLTQQSAATLIPGTVCSTTATFSAMQVCTVAAGSTAASIATLQTYNKFKPYGMTVATGGGTATNGDVNYYKYPGIYIANIGTYNGTTQVLFQITAIGYGGGNGATGAESIVQSQYVLGTSAACGSACSGATSGGGTGSGATSGSSLGGA
jgi:type IV pilus assembly protein PilX